MEVPEQSDGLALLATLSRMSITRRGDCWGCAAYRVGAPDGEPVLSGREERSPFMPSYKVHFLDLREQEVITLHHKVGWCGQHAMQVWVGGQLASVLRFDSPLNTVLFVNDAEDEPVLVINSTPRRGTVQLLTLTNKRIGVLTRVREGWLSRVFSATDTMELQLPLDLDVRYKAAVLGACVFMKFLRFEARRWF